MPFTTACALGGQKALRRWDDVSTLLKLGAAQWLALPGLLFFRCPKLSFGFKVLVSAIGVDTYRDA
ncbi:MAG: hypothetical protein R3B54_07505 [Bdellovibrionota bacterium]